MPLARASELDRLLNCQGSLHLPRDIRPIGEAVRWGNIVHSWVETGEYPEGRDGVAVKKRVEASKVDRLTLWPSGGAHEVAYALNVQTLKVVRYLPSGGKGINEQRANREAWKQAFDSHWIVGTADYVGTLLDAPWVDDTKTGRFARWRDFEYQQTFYVLCACLSGEGLQESRSTITHWPRYPIGNIPRREGVMLSVERLNQFVEQLQGLHEDYHQKKYDLYSGSHCMWCPSFNNCPEQNERE